MATRNKPGGGHGQEKIWREAVQVAVKRKLHGDVRPQKEMVGLATGGGKSKIDGSRANPSNRPPTLADAGIDKPLSSADRVAVWQEKQSPWIGCWSRQMAERKRKAADGRESGCGHPDDATVTTRSHPSGVPGRGYGARVVSQRVVYLGASPCQGVHLLRW